MSEAIEKKPAQKRVYKVTTPDKGVMFVKAYNADKAVYYCAAPEYQAKVATQDEIIAMFKDGVQVHEI